MRHGSSSLVIVIVLALAGIACAHQGEFSDGTAISPETALDFGNPQVSRVVYHEAPAGSTPLWVTFEIATPQALRIQLGVPYLDRLADYRPTLVLLGPGLPAAEVPLEPPAGLGARVLSSVETVQPEVFEEEFTGTTSWILVEQDVALPQAGRYYLVALNPTERDGKLWVATGVEEVFELDDLVGFQDTIARVRAFHELFAEGATSPCFLLPVAAAFAGWTLVRRGRAG